MAIKEKAKASPKQVENIMKDVTVQFTKAQLLKSKRYINRRDALNALLKDDKKYTFTEVDEILEKFYKGGSN